MSRRTIAIVGGGLAGTLVARNLLASPTLVDVVVIEPRDDAGPGLAYSTTDEQHLLNVPARVLGASSADPGAFVEWLHEHGRADVRGDNYVPRAWYGDYLRSLLPSAVDARGSLESTMRVVADEAVDVVAFRGRERVRLAGGASIDADEVVLAVGAPSSTRSSILPPDPRTFAHPWQANALAPVGEGTVLLVGSGLTAIDAALSLSVSDPDSRIVAISRSGRLPRVHAPVGAPRRGVDPLEWPDGPLTADALADAFSRHLGAASARGTDWREVVDAIRPSAQRLWQQMDVTEQAAFLHDHARCWELRRHRMAPQIADQLDQLAMDGRFELRTARITGIDLQPTHVSITLGHPTTGERSNLSCARVIDCTGIDGDVARAEHPLLRSLLDRGRVAPDPHGLGIRATHEGTIVGADDTPQPRLYVLGHLRRGELWETTAVIEIRAQAEIIAGSIASNRSQKAGARA